MDGYQVPSTRRLLSRVDHNSDSAIIEKLEYWKMYFNGSLMVEGAGTGIVLISLTGEQLKYVLQI